MIRQLEYDELIHEGQIFKREHRTAVEGELVQVVQIYVHVDASNDYKLGEIFTVIKADDLGVDVDRNWHDEDEPIFLLDEEYDVIVPVKE